MATTLTPEQMKRFVQAHFEDFVNKRDASVIRKNMTPAFFDHDGPGGKPTDIDGDEKMMIAMYQSMPDLRISIVEMVAEGDRVVCRNIWRWTDVSTGKKMQFHGFVLWRFEGDRIAERWATVTAPAAETSLTWTPEELAPL
jgi:predicted ester cyclase